MRTIQLMVGVGLCAASLLVVGCGPVHNPNYAQLRVNSEPQGARVYYQGAYQGTTPCDISFGIRECDYDAGAMPLGEIAVVADGWLAQKGTPRLGIEPTWRPDTSQYFSGGDRWYFSHLFILQRDPSAPQVHRYDITNRQEESDLDKATKATNLLLLLKAASGR